MQAIVLFTPVSISNPEFLVKKKNAYARNTLRPYSAERPNKAVTIDEDLDG